ncbi:hypothetical protein P152DRAFT_462388 [Eremomyces bilateralis CBS 781.70]|uniref:Uncharacterized protein n=1 Tax=Eremomyces bilateralis CBS 781.70 TaxID=1392243 RepID=A0A6G1FRV8_9PEZI|nr:uncharacterized protein P152DRAFT_462388 [Eremomyces bilateralis CBS 781.70]KAF1808524.1 hypothetical protein P152DRAFT_462388 [Eremomyces bilateralis CBS 781.70]
MRPRKMKRNDRRRDSPQNPETRSLQFHHRHTHPSRVLHPAPLVQVPKHLHLKHIHRIRSLPHTTPRRSNTLYSATLTNRLPNPTRPRASRPRTPLANQESTLTLDTIPPPACPPGDSATCLDTR